MGTITFLVEQKQRETLLLKFKGGGIMVDASSVVTHLTEPIRSIIPKVHGVS